MHEELKFSYCYVYSLYAAVSSGSVYVCVVLRVLLWLCSGYVVVVMQEHRTE